MRVTQGQRAMSSEIPILCLTAVSIGVIHTLLGPDHYLPFVAMSRAGGWTARKTLSVTVACGLGHVAGSVGIGVAGLAIGVAVMQLELLESFRGDVAAWLLIGFGLAYMTWGMMRAIRSVPHRHLHAHADGTVHSQVHGHNGVHGQVHAAADDVASVAAVSVCTPWLAFLVFVFGPCEPLIPLLMYPAAKANVGAVAAVVAAFTVATVGTMSIAVLAMRYGLSFVHVPPVGRFSHALAGLAILMCGLLVKIGL
jgi:nickel/cobalt exporter